VDRWCDIAIEWMRQADAALSAHDNNANVSVQANLASTLNAEMQNYVEMQNNLTERVAELEREQAAWREEVRQLRLQVFQRNRSLFAANEEVRRLRLQVFQAGHLITDALDVLPHDLRDRAIAFLRAADSGTGVKK
jgi:predicted  nucleic acid-binding Zn-ribbon protein